MHVEGRKVCGVCARVLDYREIDGQWIHSIGSWDPDEHDHLPVPVEDTEVHIRDRCDFCYGDGTVWHLQARPFRRGLSSFDGHWAACDTCGTLIEQNNWNGLMRRVKASWEDRHGPMEDIVERDLRGMYRTLRKNITGGLRPIDS